jgi:hypothetical protein
MAAPDHAARRRPPTLVAGAALLCALALLGAACTAGGKDRTHRKAHVRPLSGWMLASGEVFGQGLTATRLPDGDPVRLGLPNDAGVVDAVWARPGRVAFAFVQSGPNGVRLKEVRVEGTPRAFGPVFRRPNALGAAGSVFLATSCAGGAGTASIIDVAAGSTWRTVAPSCVAALSPDGRSVAYSPDGRRILEVALSGGKPSEAFDLARALGTRHPSARIREIAWGPQGLGMVAAAGDFSSVVVHTEAGDHVAEIPGTPAFLGNLRWQPNGSLLAFVSISQNVVTTQGSVLRAMDAASGQLRVLAADARGLAGTTWSPDGTLLATLGSRGAWLFVTPQGHRVRQVNVSNEVPFDWAS